MRSLPPRAGAILLGAAVFIAALVPRMVQLDQFITTDEMRWVCRSVEFRNALLAGRWADTFQIGHPGVLTMWIGSAATAARGLPPDSKLSNGCHTLSGNELIDFQARPEIYEMRELLFAGRRLMAVVLALAVAATVLLVAPLAGWQAALVAGALLAVDPFLVAHSRVLHLDALTTSLMFLSVVCMVRFLAALDLLPAARSSYGTGARRYLVLSGVLAGLAALNKAPSLFLAPFLAAVLAVAYARRCRPAGTAALRFLRDGLTVAGAAAFTCFVLWPALWVDAPGTVGKVISQALGMAAEGHELPNYFMGTILNDPGPFFYPVAIMFRTTPLVWLGLVAAAVSVVRGRDPGAGRKLTAVLAAFVLGFAAFMTLGAKKFDRYVLEVFPALDMLAAVGLTWLARQFFMSRELATPSAALSFRAGSGLARPATPYAASLPGSHARPRVTVGGVAVVALVAAQAAAVLSYLPYTLSYYNPLMGGAQAARRVLVVGWGEGLDQAAAYLNRQPDARNLRVGTWYIESFAPFFDGYASKIDGAWRDPSEVDYVLLYVNDLQRSINKPIHDQFYGKQTPEHVVSIAGIDYVYIYRNPLRQVKTPQHPLRVELADGLRLLGYDLDTAELRPGGALRATFYWQAERRTDISYTVFLHLLGSDGRLCAQRDGLPLDGKLPTRRWFAGQTVVDAHTLELGSDGCPGLFSVAFGMYQLESLKRLGAFDAEGHRLPEDQIVIPEIAPPHG